MNQNDGHELDWDDDTQRDWGEKMSEPIRFKTLSKEEYQRLKEKGKVN